ncbi:MAG: hypothetical protein NT129_01175 [Candidatus Aenigmarchaeota archaeon]|nr:hypothetical protein [Candidatus Aenigmarchaeota archaeon]
MFNKLRELFSPKPVIELGIEKIHEFIRNEFKADLEGAKKKISTMVEEIFREFSLLKALLNELKEKQHDVVFANSVKNKFCCRSLELIESLDKPEINYKALISFLEKSEYIINDISNIGFREMLHLRAFKEQMDSIAAKTKLIINKNKIAKDFINADALLEKLDKLDDKIKSIKNTQETINALNQYIMTTEKDIANSENELKEKKQQLDAFLKNDAFLKMNSIRTELEKLAKNKGSVKQKIATEFSGIEKMLKSYQHSGFATREEEKIINDYLTASDAFLLDETLEIRTLLEKVKHKIDNKELDAEGKRYNKLLYILKEISSIASLRNDYKEIKKAIAEKNEQRDELMPIFDEKASYEKEIDDAQKSIADMLKKRDMLAAELESKKKGFEAGKNNFEYMVRDMLKRDVLIKL